MPWDEVLSEGEELEGEFLSIAQSHIAEPPFQDATSFLDNMEKYMRLLGINQTLSAAILLPEFEDVRLTACCHYWVRQAVDGGFGALKDLGGSTQMQAARLQHDAKVSDRPKDQHGAPNEDGAIPTVATEVVVSLRSKGI
ncbi:MAG: hypothetical protein M1819_005012 [Sarea resinae]|nr:MAG: hypothetical protein M1819_005012 [Sarea resinae]